MAEWFFRKKSKGEVERDPGWDEYFSSNRSTVESLVRESIQNSLDATAQKCRRDPLEDFNTDGLVGDILADNVVESFVAGAGLVDKVNGAAQ